MSTNMNMNISEIQLFQQLFQNMQTAYGSFSIKQEDDNGKKRGDAKLVKRTPTTTTYTDHCTGKESMGLAPINDLGTCRWGAIDIDEYPDHKLDDLVRAIYDFGIPLVPCYSKSKKIHLFIFFDEDVSAGKVQELLNSYAIMLGCLPKTEIFPKQNATGATAKSQFSWINLPYFGNTRKMVNVDMSEAPISSFLDRANTLQVSLKMHNTLLEGIPYYDAPPCIQVGAMLRDFTAADHCRNNYLFSASVYLRMKEVDDVDQALIDLNNSFKEPIDSGRLKETVLSSLKKKTYFYLCNALPNCNKEACRKCPHGIESKLTTGLEYGAIEQWMEDPPYYTWMVNGQKLVFYSEAEIIHQNKFREQAYRYLRIMPRKVNENIWAKIVNKASQDRIVHEAIVTEGGFSIGSQFLSHTVSFFHDRRPGTDLSQLQLGRTYLDKSKDEFVFSAHAFMAYLRNVKDFRAYSSMELQTKIIDLGGSMDGKYWRIPTSKVPAPPREEVTIDFHDTEQEGEAY